MSGVSLETVVVAYGGADHLGACLATLGDGVKVTVVDNSNSDDVRAVADRLRATYIDAGANLGFGAGVNLALRRLAVNPPTYVLLLNPDARLDPDNLRALTAFLDSAANKRVAATSPRLVGEHGESQRVVWPYPSPWRAWVEAVGFGRVGARRTFVIGAVLMLRWSALLEVGFFDERFFLYAEETDWQRRAAEMGWTSALCGGAIATHVGAGTSENPRRREVLFHAGQETYVRKWFGSAGWAFYRSAAACGATARALLLRGERRAEAKRRALLYARGPKRCAGLALK